MPEEMIFSRQKSHPESTEERLKRVEKERDELRLELEHLKKVHLKVQKTLEALFNSFDKKTG